MDPPWAIRKEWKDPPRSPEHSGVANTPHSAGTTRRSWSTDWVFERPRTRLSPLNRDGVIRLVRRARKLVGERMAKSDTPQSIEEWTAHDLRRTAATMITTTGIADAPLVDRILNHSPKGVIAVYDRFQYFPQMQDALEAWGRYLTMLVRELWSVERATAQGSVEVAQSSNLVKQTGTE